MHVQIQTSLQVAVSVVRRHPRTFNINLLLERLAQQNSEPLPEQLMEASDVDDLQHSANWEAVVHHVMNTDADGLHWHVPLLQQLK